MTFSLRLFSICPRISKRNGKLVALTAWRMRFLTFGSFLRKIVVDPEREELTIHRQYCWAFRRNYRVKFSAVEAVTYGYEDWGISAPMSWSHDSIDLFSVGLRLHNGEEWQLFRFLGDGTFSNNGPWPDWLYWDDYLFDMSGTQESESRAFVDLLSKMIGVSVVPPRF